MNKIFGYSRKDRPAQRGVRKPVVTIALHKSMTKADLFEAASLTLSFLERNGIAHDAPWVQIRICIEGFDDSPKELWEDAGSRTFCKIALAPFAPALAGHLNLGANTNIEHDGMGLLGLAMVALGEEFGCPIKVGYNDLTAEPILIRIKDLVEEHAPRVNARANELNAGAKPNCHPKLVIRCGEPDEWETCLYAAPGMGLVVCQLVMQVRKAVRNAVRATKLGPVDATPEDFNRPAPKASEIAELVTEVALRFLATSDAIRPGHVLLATSTRMDQGEYLCKWLTVAEISALDRNAGTDLGHMAERALSRTAEHPETIPIVYLLQSEQFGTFTGSIRILQKGG